MPRPALLSLLALAAPAAAALPGDAVRYAQLTIHERIVIRVPRMPPATTPVAVPAAMRASPVRWKERKGPKCVPLGDLAGALVSVPGAVDLVVAGGRRIRAKLDGDCRQLDYYSGFYLKPTADGQVCADRDAIRVRSGASCGIKTFRALEAKR